MLPVRLSVVLLVAVLAAEALGCNSDRSTSPVPPQTYTGNFSAIAAGFDETCGISAAGAGYCWGANNHGVIGDSDFAILSRTLPSLIAGGLRFASISTGGLSACGVTPAGKAYCWGDNQFGELGNGTNDDRSIPTPVVGGIDFVSVSVGAFHTCGLARNGAAYCWGANGAGALGDGTTTASPVPVAVAGGLTFASVQAGGAGADHSCGLTPAGAAYCWGFNAFGQLGDGTITNRWEPVPVSGGIVFRSLAVGSLHNCGLTASGVAYCWGQNTSGTIGDGTTTNRSIPTPVSGGLSFVALKTGVASAHVCGIASNGSTYCWGSNLSGALGDNTTVAHRETPTLVTGGLTFVSLAVGDGYTCALTGAGAAYCWGFNYNGQLGDGTTISRPTPVRVGG